MTPDIDAVLYETIHMKRFKSKMTTIKEVARKAGVSVGTVSNVINGLDTVSEYIKQKVKEVIKELDYRPSRLAAGLSSKKTKNIGLVVPDISSPFYSDLVKGISDKLQSLGYEMYLCNSNNSLEKEWEIMGNLKSMWVDGIILIPVYDQSRDLGQLKNWTQPLVILNRDLGLPEIDTILFDNFSGAYNAVSYLLDQGHQDIICINGPKSSNSARERYLGWKRAMSERGMHKEDFLFWGNFSITSGKKLMSEALARFSCIDAVFATSDLLALGAIKVINSKGLSVPEDISLMGFGDIFICQYLNPPLTTVARPFEATGNKAVEVLVERIKNPEKKPERIIIDGEIEERNSVAIKNSNPCPGQGLLT